METSKNSDKVSIHGGYISRLGRLMDFSHNLVSSLVGRKNKCCGKFIWPPDFMRYEHLHPSENQSYDAVGKLGGQPDNRPPR